MQTVSLNLLEKITALEFSVKERAPNLPILLSEIKEILLQDPEQVTIMTEEQIAVIMSGLSAQTQTYITTKIATGTKKGLKNITLDDI